MRLDVSNIVWCHNRCQIEALTGTRDIITREQKQLTAELANLKAFLVRTPQHNYTTAAAAALHGSISTSISTSRGTNLTIDSAPLSGERRTQQHIDNHPATTLLSVCAACELILSCVHQLQEKQAAEVSQQQGGPNSSALTADDEARLQEQLQELTAKIADLDEGRDAGASQIRHSSKAATAQQGQDGSSRTAAGGDRTAACSNTAASSTAAAAGPWYNDMLRPLLPPTYNCCPQNMPLFVIPGQLWVVSPL